MDKEIYQEKLEKFVDNSKKRIENQHYLLNSIQAELDQRELKDLSTDNLVYYRTELLKMIKYEEEWQASCMTSIFQENQPEEDDDDDVAEDESP